MEIKIYEKNKDNEIIKELGTIKVKKNLKNVTITKKVMEYLSKEYSINITRYLWSGNISFATGEANGYYVLFGNNLPFRFIDYNII